jgi:hypothetical protein
MFEHDLGVPHVLCSSRKFILGLLYWQAFTKQVFENIPYVLNRVKIWRSWQVFLRLNVVFGPPLLADSGLMTAAAVFDNRQAVRVCTNSSYSVPERAVDDPITIPDSCEVLGGIPLITQPRSLLPWSQWEHNQRGFKVVCNASPYLDAETAGTELRNHAVDVSRVFFRRLTHVRPGR